MFFPQSFKFVVIPLEERSELLPLEVDYRRLLRPIVAKNQNRIGMLLFLDLSLIHI